MTTSEHADYTPTENELLEWVASGIKQATQRPGIGGQTFMPLTPPELDVARDAIAKVRMHDAALASTPSPAQPTEASDLVGLREVAAKFIVAYDVMIELGGGVGKLAMERPDLMVDFDAWYEGPAEDYYGADVVVGLIDQIITPSPVQGADDRLAQAIAEVGLPENASLDDLIQHHRAQAATAATFDALATYPQSPQAALNEVRAGSDPESDLFNVTGKLMAANEQIARGNKFVEDSQYLWRTHRPEVFHSLMRRLIKEYEQAGDTE